MEGADVVSAASVSCSERSELMERAVCGCCVQGANSHLVPVSSDLTLDQIAVAQFSLIPAGGGFSFTPTVNGAPSTIQQGSSSSLTAAMQTLLLSHAQPKRSAACNCKSLLSVTQEMLLTARHQTVEITRSCEWTLFGILA